MRHSWLANPGLAAVAHIVEAGKPRCLCTLRVPPCSTRICAGHRKGSGVEVSIRPSTATDGRDGVWSSSFKRPAITELAAHSSLGELSFSAAGVGTGFRTSQAFPTVGDAGAETTAATAGPAVVGGDSCCHGARHERTSRSAPRVMPYRACVPIDVAATHVTLITLPSSSPLPGAEMAERARCRVALIAKNFVQRSR